MPSQELIAQMRAECPGVALQAEHRKFIDYWIAQPGQKGVKVDWPATWRNWIRKARPSTNGASRRQQETDAWMQRAMERAIAADEADAQKQLEA